MKTLSAFHILPDLPEDLAPLWDLAYNLWWTWNRDLIRLLYQIDPEAWISSGRNPLRFLSSLSQHQLEELARDPKIKETVKNILSQFSRYQQLPPQLANHPAHQHLKVAYFSAEFGLAECLPIYSGGLGVLAGDHLKAASDLGLPLVGVGLLYRQGYFHQALNPDGWQLENYPENDFDLMPVRSVRFPGGEPLIVEVAYPHGPVWARVWAAQVGKVALYLLDTSLERNRPEDRDITALLYGGDKEMRLRQEILLGIGGQRAVASLGINPAICHMNEGHSAFQALERIRVMMEDQGLSFAAAREATAAGNLFTTHTPVAAGNDWFPPDLVESYLGPYRERLGLSREEFLGLGRVNPEDWGSDFCMTVLALRLSAHSNGVSRLHGQVSRKMWGAMWPNFAEAEVPITHITNGVHLPSWTSLEMADLFDRHLGEPWRLAPADPKSWQGLTEVREEALWSVREYRRQRLVSYVRFHLRNQFARQGMGPSQLERLLQGLNPHALTIGFARRFATYKRGSLLFRDPQRLAALLADPKRPVQLLFAGKAHPHDHPGKELIREIVSLSRQEPFAGRLFFLEDYDMNLARYLVQGCDVWLNNPRRPEEASGTSGMKAALNGVLNISVLDGWWVEACELHPGWCIGRGETYEDLTYQDQVESQSLYDLLETEVIPLFYQRDAQGLPTAWVGRVRETIQNLAPFFNTNRMVRQYAEKLYLPNQLRWQQLNSDQERIHRLSQWKGHVRTYWSQLRIEGVEAALPTQLRVGMRIPLRVTLDLGQLAPHDVRVELYLGKVTAQRELVHTETLPLSYQGRGEGHRHLFAGDFPCTNPGTHGYTVRVVPSHPDLRDPLDLGLVSWA
ncbi:MAG: alpha-glucan family phosphorylase [Candidatus Handelsmanbacteria bacterium]|nr:alpha-glucan family phosphorylase [Candidatus Handelsmanbacteria bacterium]